MQSYFAISLSLIVCLSSLLQAQGLRAQGTTASVIELRVLCEQAVQSDDRADAFHLVTEKLDESSAIHLGYKAMADLMLSKHAFMPWTKLKYFRHAKEKLERSLQMDSTNIELHFLRFTVQSRVPAMLGYRDNVQDDKNILIRYLATADSRERDPDLFRRILHEILASDVCSETEKASLRTSQQK